MPEAPSASPETDAAPAADPVPERRARTGWLAGLPPIPQPVRVDVPGLAPRTAFLVWILLAVGLLAVGIFLNWFLTAGEWVPPAPQLVDGEFAFGETPVQFLTTHPYDLFTAAIFVASILFLALSLVTRREDGSEGVFRPFALATGTITLVYVAFFALVQLTAAQPGGVFATSAGIGITLTLAATTIGLALIGRHRNALAAKRHEIRAVGWVLFALHWAATGMYYFVIEGGDWVNMAFAYASVFLLTYFAYQEFVSRTLGEDNRSLRFLAGAIVIAATVWFAFLRVEFLSKWLIETVAWHTILMLQMFGHDVVIGVDGRTGFVSAISYAETMFPRTVIIILACTAIQSMMIFIAAALAVDGAAWKRRLLAIAITAPIVYLLNLLRNTGIIIMWADRWLERNFAFITNSDMAFNIAHNWIGKGGSLIALVLIAILLFRLLPEVLRALVGILDLPRRRGPLEQHWRAIRGEKDDVGVVKKPEPTETV